MPLPATVLSTQAPSTNRNTPIPAMGDAFTGVPVVGIFCVLEPTMAFINELDVVNACIKSTGRSPINSIAGGSPIITSAQSSLQTALMEEQGIGWWFNRELVTLQPNTDKQYYCPADTLQLTTDENPPWLSTRGARLYDNRIGDYFTGTAPVTVDLIRLIPLDDLPYQAQRLVQCAAVLDFQKSFDADAAKIQSAKEDYGKALALLRTSHIRAVKANMLYQGEGGRRVQRQRDLYPDYRWRR